MLVLSEMQSNGGFGGGVDGGTLVNESFTADGDSRNPTTWGGSAHLSGKPWVQLLLGAGVKYFRNKWLVDARQLLDSLANTRDYRLR